MTAFPGATPLDAGTSGVRVGPLEAQDFARWDDFVDGLPGFAVYVKL